MIKHFHYTRRVNIQEDGPRLIIPGIVICKVCVGETALRMSLASSPGRLVVAAGWRLPAGGEVTQGGAPPPQGEEERRVRSHKVAPPLTSQLPLVAASHTNRY